jgi:hypothetical protein
LFSPGEQYAYWDSAANELGWLVTKIANRSMEALFQDRIGSKIGLSANAWEWGEVVEMDGLTVNGGAGNIGGSVKISAIELARIGLLVLNRGNWNDTQVVDSNWIDEATQVQVPATIPDYGVCGEELDGTGVYGYLWWVNGWANGQRLWPDADPSTFAAYGAKNNLMFVVPEWDMVIVRLGLGPGAGGTTTITDDQWGEFLVLIEDSIIDCDLDDCDLDARFQRGTVSTGAKYYTDLWPKLTSVPDDYVGLEMIKTPHADRLLTAPSDYLTFEMTQAGRVYVAYDTRGGSLPDWMNGFVDTGDEILTSWGRQPALRVYYKFFEAGACVNFGGNRAPGYTTGNPGNYLVFY